MDFEGGRPRNGVRVLVVDDNLTCLRILEVLLLKCNYHVTTASKATSALKMLREKKDEFDIVISDVHMPELDGFKLLELIEHEMDIPVVLLSANDEPEHVMKGVSLGAVDYLLKPVRLKELKSIWQHVVRKNKCSPNVSDSKAGEDGTTVHGGMLNRINTAAAYRTGLLPNQNAGFPWLLNPNQLPCSCSFHSGFPSADASQIKSAFRQSLADGPAKQSTPNEDLKGSQASSISYNYKDIYLLFMFLFIVVMYFLLIM